MPHFPIAWMTTDRFNWETSFPMIESAGHFTATIGKRNAWHVVVNEYFLAPWFWFSGVKREASLHWLESGTGHGVNWFKWNKIEHWTISIKAFDFRMIELLFRGFSHRQRRGKLIVYQPALEVVVGSGINVDWVLLHDKGLLWAMSMC